MQADARAGTTGSMSRAGSPPARSSRSPAAPNARRSRLDLARLNKAPIACRELEGGDPRIAAAPWPDARRGDRRQATCFEVSDAPAGGLAGVELLRGGTRVA